MASLDPAVALRSCEQALRALMKHVYGQHFGSGWIEKVSTSKQRDKWAERAKDEQARLRKGTARVPEFGLEYSEFYELVSIAEKHWSPLSVALGKQRSTLALLEVFEDLRNSVAHGRELPEFEQELLSGIATRLRNQVTIYMSSRDPSGDYYPRIESVTDSFGNTVIPSDFPKMEFGYIETDLVLTVGQTVTFTCRGIDPKGRPLTWRNSWNGKAVSALRQDGITTNENGQEVILSWVVSDRDVMERCGHQITMCSNGEYHRHGNWDHSALFWYRVIPPDAER